MRSKVRGMSVPPELCFYFISVPRVLITKSAKLKDAGAERLVAAAAGKSLCIFYVFLMWSCTEQRASGTAAAVSMTPSDETL